MRDPIKNVVSIPPGAPFLPTLVDALVNGRLIEGFAPGNDPLALSSVTIWVPTRRAVRSLATAFAEKFDCDAAILPSIRALGDVDDDSLFLDRGDAPTLEPVISGLERHLILSRLVAAWAEQLQPDQRALYEGADIVMPSSLADAIRFASDLTHLMDTVATEEADWKALETLVPDEHAEWWQLTLTFLKIAMQAWPQTLAERGMEDAATIRAKMLRAQASTYREKRSAGPVIAAGSTGSIPATADLLKTIAGMTNGVVVLPGLDRDLDDETWQKVDLPDNDRDDSGTAPGHPQYGLKKLLSHLGVQRGVDELPHIGGLNDTSSGFMRLRETLVSEALRPSFSTGAWQAVFDKTTSTDRAQAFAGVKLVEAKGEREEALAIAMALRETLQEAGKTAALVTPDRNLARRVAVEMRRFGVAVDDSAGQPLRNQPAGTFARLVLQMTFGKPDPLVLISLLKHPHALFGATPQRARTAARLFELSILRGAISPPLAGEFHALMTEKKIMALSGKGRVHRSLRRFSNADWQDVAWLAERLDEIFARPESQPENEPEMMPDKLPEQTFAELAKRTITILEACAIDEHDGLTGVYEGEDGRALYDFLGELLDLGTSMTATPQEWPDVFDALLGQRAVRPLSSAHPRVSILGPLEARLQSYDRVVLGGLNEKTWPAASRNDPFLSRPMKSALGLPPPERRTGLAAHDFQMLMGMEDIVLTRSAKSDNAPTVASRWVQRLTMVAGEEATDAMRARGRVYSSWAHQIDQPIKTGQNCSQPRPAPPVNVRPNRLSITEIETWVADPYAIYAKHILKLDALEPLLRNADMRERGVLYHGIFEEFMRGTVPGDDDQALKKLLSIARLHFDTTEVPTEHAALWWPRFKTIAQAFVAWQMEHMRHSKKVHVELYGRTDAGLDGFTLSGRVDRLDEMQNGSFQLFDYKTGQKPDKKQARNLNAPQLPLSVAMVVKGAFEPELQITPGRLAYIRLRPKDELVVDWVDDETKPGLSAAELADASWDMLASLIEAYRKPQQEYRSKARAIVDKGWASDYDHLGRVLEWSTGESTPDDEGDFS